MQTEAALAETARRLGLVRLDTATTRAPHTRRLIRSGELRRVRRGVYCNQPDLTPGYEERVVAALLVLPRGSMACGLTAGRLWNLEGLPALTPAEPVHILVPGKVDRAIRECRLHQRASEEQWIVGGIPCTSLPSTVIRLAGGHGFEAGFVMVEAALQRWPALAELLPAELEERPPRGGVRIARRVLDVAGTFSETPLESQMRLLVIRAKLPPPVQQAVIRSNGRFVARVDFLWSDAMLVVEVDGLGKYRDLRELAAEKRRQNALVAAGYRVLRFTWDDVVRDPAAVVAALRSALAFA